MSVFGSSTRCLFPFLPSAHSLAVTCAGAEHGQRGITPLPPVLRLFMAPVITASGLGDLEAAQLTPELYTGSVARSAAGATWVLGVTSA